MKKTSRSIVLVRTTLRALSPEALARGRGGLMYYPPQPPPQPPGTSLEQLSQFWACRY
jgi:hypothetical protein